MIMGIKSLNYSASEYGGGEEEQLTAKEIVLTMGFAVLLTVVLFVVLPPAYLLRFVQVYISSNVLLNLVEGLIKISFFSRPTSPPLPGWMILSGCLPITARNTKRLTAMKAARNLQWTTSPGTAAFMLAVVQIFCWLFCLPACSSFHFSAGRLFFAADFDSPGDYAPPSGGPFL